MCGWAIPCSVWTVWFRSVVHGNVILLETPGTVCTEQKKAVPRGFAIFAAGGRGGGVHNGHFKFFDFSVCIFSAAGSRPVRLNGRSERSWE